jgi:hypothetical protein
MGSPAAIQDRLVAIRPSHGGAAASLRGVMNKPGRRNLAEAEPDNGARFCFPPEPEAKH